MSSSCESLSSDTRDALASACESLQQLGRGQDDPASLSGVLAEVGLTSTNLAENLGEAAQALARVSGSGAWLFAHYGHAAALLRIPRVRRRNL